MPRQKMRLASVMQLKQGQELEYKRRHDALWPELEAKLKEHGVHHYSIFLHPETLQLFAYVEVEDEQRWAAIADTDECQRWWQYMADIMEVNPDMSPTNSALNAVFYLQ
ncbi:L-rhamnose mutarotase [Photobacterium satsumensis]|uniref:L-rhamnose mutarotase n=1 Tax=Photobacterium satsumensis TaxID=2910239 RepID=UPI003D0E17C4